MEIALQSKAHPFDAHAVVEQAIEDSLADTIGVLGAGFDSFHLVSEGLGTGTTGAVFSDLDFEHDNLARSKIANATDVNILAASLLAARKSLRGAKDVFRAYARLHGIHACVPPGLDT
jgi:hypothetical protein